MEGFKTTKIKLTDYEIMQTLGTGTPQPRNQRKLIIFFSIYQALSGVCVSRRISKAVNM